MKFALHFANTTFSDADGAKRLGRAAEAAGFESVIGVEHVVWPSNYESKYPYSPSGRLPGGPTTKMPDPLIWMAFVAGATSRLKFTTGVMILPQRNPLVLAKEVATLDHMSGGRLNLGIGVGWLREEFAALGVPFSRRGARTDEYIQAMRALWADGEASFSGEFVHFNAMNCYPKPVNGGVPIHIGGHSKAAARRAGRLGDGFFPATGAQRDIAPLIDTMREAAVAAGRDPGAVEITTGCPEALPDSGADPLAAIDERRAAGIGRVALPVTAFLPDLETALARFGETVIQPTT